MNGWIKIHRSILDSWIWQDEKHFRWWMTILLTVNHSATKFPVGNKIFTCKPGESFRSVEEWSSLFGCAKKTTIKFFILLKKDDMITTKTVGNGNRRKHTLSVVNWDKYQKMEPENEPKGNRNVPPNKKDKNDKNISFEQFWNLYDKKIDKPRVLKLWNKLTTTEINEILEYVPKYIQATPDKQFRKNPATFLRYRSWENGLHEIKSSYGQTAEPKYKPQYARM